MAIGAGWLTKFTTLADFTENGALNCGTVAVALNTGKLFVVNVWFRTQ